jgi:hypothetical protein
MQPLKAGPTCVVPVRRFDMPLFIYRCPNTGLNVQGFTADGLTEDDKQTQEAVSCTACRQMHWVNPKTGKVLAHK